MWVIIGSNVKDLFLSVLASLVVSGCVLSRGGLFVPGAALHFPVSSLPTCSALGVFCWAGGAPWGVMFGAVSTGVLLLLFLSLSLSLSFPLAFLWGSLTYGVDIFGAAQTHGIHFSIDGNVGPACLQHLGGRRCNRHCEEFLHQFPVVKGSNKAVLHVPFFLVIGGKVTSVGQSSQAVN